MASCFLYIIFLLEDLIKPSALGSVIKIKAQPDQPGNSQCDSNRKSSIVGLSRNPAHEKSYTNISQHTRTHMHKDLYRHAPAIFVIDKGHDTEDYADEK